MQTPNRSYELLDFGSGRKLERFGDVILDRPEILAEKDQKTRETLWNQSTAIYLEKQKSVGVWKEKNRVSEFWTCEFPLHDGVFKLQLSLGKFKHVGVFPEQQQHWNYLFEKVSKGTRILNLFGYTGAASVVAAKAGAEVYHVDSSRSILKVARENADLNGIDNIRWIEEDAMKFAMREGRRKNRYDFIIMDPPIFGRGKKGEIWKLEEGLEPLVKMASQLLHEDGTLILNTYSPKLGLDEMRQICQKFKLQCIDSGWLSVSTGEGDTLNLSKYVLACSSS